MWQRLRLQTNSQNQFLGDMFELFLDDGIKQSEGQYFTPLPICKFIVASLPLPQMIKDSPEPIKAIDYACGSGHFLNEYAHQIEPLVATHGANLSDYYSQIIGVEKEDRLAKVAKVAAYMHGQEQIRILDADALASNPEILSGIFDVLVANPPFAVEGFLQTLSDEDKKHYQLINATGATSNTNTIQCFFIERIHHLLAPGGVVGVIVPSSILSNSNLVYTRTREILLRFFDFVSIVELGSGTFGKTGTSTVVLFLRRKIHKPEDSEHYANRVDDFFEGDTQSEEYQDHYLIQAYCEHIGVPYEQYTKLFAQTSLEALDELLQYDILKSYQQDFHDRSEIKNRKKSVAFRKLTTAEQNAEMESRFIAYLHTIERDKLLYFILACKQENNVLIVSAPHSNKERKQYLGYEWSEAKGSEGIKYFGGKTVNDIITPLFDPSNLSNDTKINTVIKSNYIGISPNVLPKYCRYASLINMLDFSRTDFNKAISINPKQEIAIETKWEMVKLGEICNLYQPKTITAEEILDEGIYKVYGANGAIGFYHEFNHDLPEVVIACRGATCGAVNFTEAKSWITGNAMVVQPKKDNIQKKFLFEILDFCDLNPTITGAAQPQITRENLSPYKIPLPPLEVQRRIADKCDAVDEEIDNARLTITTKKQKIEEELGPAVNGGYEMKRLGDIADIKSGGTPSRNNTDYWENGSIPWLRSEVCKETYITNNINYERITQEGLDNSNAKWLPSDTTLIALVGATKGKTGFLTFDAATNQNIAGIKSLSETILDIYIFYYLKSLYDEIIRNLSQYDMLNQAHIKNTKIPVPPLAIQQSLVAKIEKLEKEIAKAQAAIDTSAERKMAIFKIHL